MKTKQTLSPDELGVAPCSAFCLLTLQQALGVISSVEWEGNEKGSRCIVCYEHVGHGHSPECALARALSNIGLILEQNKETKTHQIAASQALDHAIRLCKERKSSMNTRDWNAACDDLAVFISAAKESLELGLPMESLATAQGTGSTR